MIRFFETSKNSTVFLTQKLLHKLIASVKVPSVSFRESGKAMSDRQLALEAQDVSGHCGT